MKIRSFTAALCLAVLAPFPIAGQEFPTLAEDVPAGSGEVRACEVEGARVEVHCGRFRVYEDRAAAAGPTVDLAFVLLRDPGSPTPGEVLIPLPGGPGQSFTEQTPGRARNELPWGRDLLLIDVRGVGQSEALDCPEFQIPLQDRFGTVFPPEHIRMCRDSLAARARLDLYTTANSVDDIEEVRRWLGYAQVNLFGVSYGTRVAQVYMRRHPDAIRAVILNSVAPVFEPGYVHMARSLQTSLDLVVAACVEDEQCSTTNPELPARLDAVLTRLRAGPIGLDAQGERVEFTLGDFSYAMRGLLYGRAREVPGLLSAAYRDEYADLVQYYVERTGWVGEAGGSAGYHFSALCAEDIAPLTDEDVERATAGTFMGDHLIAGYRATCDAWDVAELPESWWEPVRSDLPVLIISGERDPVTPPEWGAAVAEYLPNSIHVVVPGGGHGAGNACTGQLQQQFMTEASVANLDVSCMEREE